MPRRGKVVAVLVVTSFDKETLTSFELYHQFWFTLYISMLKVIALDISHKMIRTLYKSYFRAILRR